MGCQIELMPKIRFDSFDFLILYVAGTNLTIGAPKQKKPRRY